MYMNDTIKMSKQRRWAESKAHSSWQIFKIMAEFVDGFESLAKLGPCISIFGSARTQPGQEYYELSVEIARRLALIPGLVVFGHVLPSPPSPRSSTTPR